MEWDTACAELNDFGRVCVDRRLVVGRAGNISMRLNTEEFVISRRAGRLDRLTPAELVRCSLATDLYQGSVRPSTETPMHRAIYRAQAQAQAIVHSSAFYTTLVACSDTELRLDLVPESMAYLNNMGRVPYFHPGTPELAEAAGAEAQHNVIILENHGLLVWGKTLEEAVQVSEMMEQYCQMIVFARLGQGDFQLRYLGEDMMRDFQERVMYGRR